MTDAQHMTDRDLVRELDGEPAAPDELEAHLAACPRCRTRLETLEHRSGRFRRLLEASGSELPEPEYDPGFLQALRAGPGVGGVQKGPRVRRAASRSRPWRDPRILRWAAAVALLGVGLSVAPVRAWVADAVRAAWTVVMEDGGEVVQRGPAGPTRVETRIAGGLLRVAVTAGGLDAVAFRRVEGATSTASLGGGGAAGEILVTADGFRVVPAGDRATLEVTVPAGVDEVVVEADGSVASRRVLAPSDSAWTVELR